LPAGSIRLLSTETWRRGPAIPVVLGQASFEEPVISFWKKLRPSANRQRPSLASTDEAAAEALRARGVKIGKACRIYSTDFSTEPYLVEIGDRVRIAGGVKFLTHDGSARMLEARRPRIQSFGRIVIGDETFIGENAIILPGTTIGAYSIIGAGAVVRGAIPENSLVIGNPASVVGRASLYLERLERSEHALDSFGLPEEERRALILTHFKLGDGSDAGDR
jgi:acetyltransferase-like isoleucine patch superfamily enzyme